MHSHRLLRLRETDSSEQPDYHVDGARQIPNNSNIKPSVQNRQELPAETGFEPKNPSLSSLADDKKNETTERSMWTITSDWFVWEVSAMVLSLGLLVAIIVILSRFNHRPQPSWTYMSLNSLISWLSTFSKGSVLFAISETIGQLKWAWLSKQTRPLSDLRTFDSASRGLYGSAELIWSMRARHFAVFSGFAIILATSFDPFVQNLIHYYPKLVEDPSQVAIIRNNSYFGANGGDTNDMLNQYVDPTLKGNVYNAVLNSDGGKTWGIPNFTCSTGNCTWDPIAALEMSASCVNVTHELNQTCGAPTDPSYPLVKENCTVELPGGSQSAWFVPGKGSTRSLSRPFVIGSRDPSYCGDPSALLPYLYFIAPEGLLQRISKPGISVTSLQAMQCTIRPIVRSFRAQVTNGSYHEDTLGIWTKWVNMEVENGLHGFEFHPSWGPEMGMGHGQKFKLIQGAVGGIKDFLFNVFHGSSLPGLHNFVYETDSYLYAARDFVQAIVAGNIAGCQAKDISQFKCAVENTATAMSKTFRDSTFDGAEFFMPWANASAETRGRAMTSKTYVTVHWQWISSPVLVWLLGCISLVGTIWRTRAAGVPRWKNDPLPLLFLYDHGQKDHPVAHDMEEGSVMVNMYKGQYRFHMSAS